MQFEVKGDVIKVVMGVVLLDIEVLCVYDLVGCDYLIWVVLLVDYVVYLEKYYLVLYVIDVLYSFLLVCSVCNMVGQKGVNIEDFILVGLLLQEGLIFKQSCLCDYMFSNLVCMVDGYYSDDVIYGGVVYYCDFLVVQVLLMVDVCYCIDFVCCMFVGYFYGVLFGVYVLMIQLDMFSIYILFSLLLWFDQLLLLCMQDVVVILVQLMWVLLLVGSYEMDKLGLCYLIGNDMLWQIVDFIVQFECSGCKLKVDNVVIDGEDYLIVYSWVIICVLLDVMLGEGLYISG